MNSKDNKSSRELKREVLQELSQVNSDIDQIQGRLTPGQFIDDALFRPVGRSPRAIFDHLKANPIGTAFLSIGTLLLSEDDGHVTYETQMRNRSGAVIENTRYQATLLKGKISEVKVNEKIHGVIDRTKSKVTGLKEKISGKKNADTTGEFNLGDGGELGASSIDQLKENVSEELDTVKNLDPMTYVAIGAGLGALTGLALPVSEKEQSMIDQKAAGKLNEFSSEFQDAINQSVKVLKDEFLGKFTDFDLSIFGKKNSSNETYQSNSNQF